MLRQADGPNSVCPVTYTLNKMNVFNKLLLLSAVLLAASCSESDGNRVVLLVKCSDREPRQGQIVRFGIDTFTADGSDIEEVRISSFDPENGSCEQGVISADGPKLTAEWEYRVPAFNGQNVPLEMRFRSVAGGFSQTAVVNLIVSPAALPVEYKDITLWSPASGRADGFSLTSRSTIFTSESPDEEIDLYVQSSAESGIFEPALHSKTALRFVKTDGFDYAAATASSINGTFGNFIKSNSATGLAEGDSVIFGRDDNAVGVLRIESIADYAGVDNDCIVLSIKLIE